MLEPPLPIWLSTIRSESSEMDESTSIWLQFPFGFGVMKREKYWRFFVKLREITLGESSRSESSRLWVVEFRGKEKNKEDQGEEVHGGYRQSAKGKKKKKKKLCGTFWSWEEVVGKKRGKKEKKKRVRVRVWRRKKKEKRRKYGTRVEEKKRGKRKGKKKKMLSQYFHNKF